jgi:hypothetical protein
VANLSIEANDLILAILDKQLNGSHNHPSLVTSDEEEQHIATLVHEDEYKRNAGQIAKIYSRHLVYVKRKEFSLKPYEIVEFPLWQCSSIFYEIKWAITSMVFGGLLVGLIATILILIPSVNSGTRIPIGALTVALVFGATRLCCINPLSPPCSDP